MTDPYRGSCLCAGVRFEADEFGPNAGHCHCSMCRRFHGAAYATLAEVPRASFRWLSGEDLLKSYEAENGTVRRFCSRCGSSLTFYSPRGSDDVVEIALGCFEDPVPVTPDAHIYVDSGAAWARPADVLPHHRAGRNSEHNG